MITLCIRYTIDASKVADFEAYGRDVAGPIERCGGKVVGYYAPTADPEHVEVARRAAQAGVILVEDRSFVQRVS